MTGGFLTFDIAGTPFALDNAEVIEVAESTRVTRLPFSPPHVDGVANVAGRILPVLDVTGCPSLGLAWGGGRKGGLLIVVRAVNGLVALRAGRIGGSLPVDRVTLEPPAVEDAGAPVVGRLRHGDRALRLLALERLELGRGAAQVAAAGEGKALTGFAADPPDPSRERDTLRLLIVEAGGRVHALDMADIVLVFPVTEVRSLPNAPALVRGMGRVQRRPVLLTDPLSGCPLHRTAHGVAPDVGGYAVVHVTPRGPVGVRVDAVRGVARVPLDRVKTGEADAPNEIVDYDGAWLDVRSGMRMLGEHLDEIGPLIPDGGDMADSRLPRRLYRRFLTFLVEERLYAMEFERVRRVVEVSGRLRLPQGGRSFDGLTDVDGSILPVLDLRRLLARGPVGQTSAESGVAILIEIQGGTVAVIADSIQRIRKIPSDDVDPMSDRLTAAVIRLDSALIPVLRPEGLMADAKAAETAGSVALPPVSTVSVNASSVIDASTTNARPG
ncbi:chemotaxis protein CheW [Azospirillum griseum]|uniref:Chemotaxis protein CheW n=1 Tax=Azospirillum griseum TaxID=2496639 RepID=A0A431VK57_9PROT|nr:chemotaxis protein CheW [Azospirillum griseum]RTR21434.1 chemotaxis protein CheW [Azospirillum griseum]